MIYRDGGSSRGGCWSVNVGGMTRDGLRVRGDAWRLGQKAQVGLYVQARRLVRPVHEVALAGPDELPGVVDVDVERRVAARMPFDVDSAPWAQ